MGGARPEHAILEARELERRAPGTCSGYPGIRSRLRHVHARLPLPAVEEAKAIADGPSILALRARHGARVRRRRAHPLRPPRARAPRGRATRSCWTVEARATDTGETVRADLRLHPDVHRLLPLRRGLHARLRGHRALRAATIVHPQHWPEDLDYAGKRVVVIGSGATAVTLVPAMAERAEKVTMLQRSPTYVVSLPGVDPLARPRPPAAADQLAYAVVRWKNVLMTIAVFQLSRRRPRWSKAMIRKGVERRLPPGYDIDTHFKPDYNPGTSACAWFPTATCSRRSAPGGREVVTDRIETFTESGLTLESGAELEADVIVTATGLNLLALGGIELDVDGEPVGLPEKMTYKGMMLEGVPNLVVSIGYTNASWTLKCDLTCEYVCRLINHMDAHGLRGACRATPTPRSPGADDRLQLRLRPALDRRVPRARAPSARGGCTRTTPATCSRCAARRVDDGVLELAGRTRLASRGAIHRGMHQAAGSAGRARRVGRRRGARGSRRAGAEHGQGRSTGPAAGGGVAAEPSPMRPGAAASGGATSGEPTSRRRPRRAAGPRADPGARRPRGRLPGDLGARRGARSRCAPSRAAASWSSGSGARPSSGRRPCSA